MTPALAAQLSQNVNQHVIVIMKSQLGRRPGGQRRGERPRRRRSPATQQPLMSELRQVHATHVKAYTADQLVRRHGVGGRGVAAEGQLRGGRGHPGRDHPRGGADTAASPGTAAKTTTASALRTDASTSLTPERDPRRLRPERPGPARPGGPLADGRRLGQPAPADRALAGHHRRGREGRLDRRRARPEQRQLHPAGRHVGVRPGHRRRLPGLHRRRPGRRSPAATRRSSTPTRSPARASTSTTCTSFSAQPDPTAVQHPDRGRGPGRQPGRPRRVRLVRRTPPSPTSCRRSTTRSRPTTST